MCHNIYRWERGADGVSERFKLHYCQALGIQPSQFGLITDRRSTEEPAMPSTAITSVPPAIPATAVVPVAIASPTGSGLLSADRVAYRGGKESGLDRSIVEREVLMTAHDGSEHAEQADERGIGQVTMEQLHADLVRLSGLADTGEPFPVFLDMRRVRARVYRLLDQRLWPREQTDLYFLLGCLNGLMGITANRLGYPDAAEELIRAGWAYANAIDHRPLMAQLRQQLAYVAFWRGGTRESRDLAASGLEYLSEGPIGADLHLKYARAAAQLGDADAARQAIGAAHDARDREHHDDLMDLGGEFVISLATHHSLAGMALAEIAGAESEAAGELEDAVGLYNAGPGPGEQHWFGGKALASTDLATLQLRSGALDAAAATLGQVLSLPPTQRINALTTRLSLVRAELRQPIYHRSAEAHGLDEQIEEFGRETIAVGLHSLPGGPG
jgi:hypothetical protein